MKRTYLEHMLRQYELVERVKEYDPDADEAMLKDIDKDIKAIVTAAAEFAQASEEPDPSELFTDILVEA